MTAVKRGEMPIPLARMRERVAAWRATRAKGARIPDGVWKEAARLAATHGVSRTSTALGLAYYTLKKRVQGMPGVGSASASKPAFVELITPTAIPTSECLIECQSQLTATYIFARKARYALTGRTGGSRALAQINTNLMIGNCLFHCRWS